MPEFPEKPTKTISTGSAYIFGGGIPIVRSISGYFLNQEGWKHEKGNRYVKGGNYIEFDGVHWVVNGKDRVEFVHELNKLLKNK